MLLLYKGPIHMRRIYAKIVFIKVLLFNGSLAPASGADVIAIGFPHPD